MALVGSLEDAQGFWELVWGCIWCGPSRACCWGLAGSFLSVSLLCRGPSEKQIRNAGLKSWVTSYPLPEKAAGACLSRSVALPQPRAAEMLKKSVNQSKRVLPAESKGFPRQPGSSPAAILHEWFSPINFSNCFWKSQQCSALVASQ